MKDTLKVDEDHSCEWCAPASIVPRSGHQAFIKTQEDNINSLRAELHRAQVENKRLSERLVSSLQRGDQLGRENAVLQTRVDILEAPNDP